MPEELTNQPTKYESVEAMHEYAKSLFGEDMKTWRFICPVCRHSQSVQDYMDAGAEEGMIGFSCVGRAIESSRDALGGSGEGPCNYTSGGLFKLSPVSVLIDGEWVPMFEFDVPDAAS